MLARFLWQQQDAQHHEDGDRQGRRDSTEVESAVIGGFGKKIAQCRPQRTGENESGPEQERM